MRKAIRAAVKDGHDHDRRRVRRVARAGARRRRPPGSGRRGDAARAARRSRSASAGCRGRNARLAAATGYGAGVRSPGWYDHVFRHPGPEGVARFFVDAARVLRAVRPAGLARPPDRRHARGRRAGGDARPPAARARRGARRRRHRDGRAVAGRAPAGGRRTRSAAVPDDAPQVPLARDLAQRQRAARLKPEADERVVELDLRTPNGLRRSHLLHQLTALGVPWGSLEEGRGSSGTFRETWRLVWRPEWSVRLVEVAGSGTTVEQAATNRLVERARVGDGVVDDRRRPRPGAAGGACPTPSSRSSACCRPAPPAIPTSPS